MSDLVRFGSDFDFGMTGLYKMCEFAKALGLS